MKLDFEITKHAARQWGRRTGETDPAVLRQTWDEETSHVVEIELDAVNRTRALLNHNFSDARYFRSRNGWVFVVCGDKVVTVHGGAASRFNKCRKKP